MITTRYYPLLSLMGAGTILLALIFWAVWKTNQAVTALKVWDLATASTQATQALRVVTPLSWATFTTIPDLEFWREGLTLVTESPNFSQVLQPSLDPQRDPLTQLSLQPLVTVLETTSKRLAHLTALCQRQLIPKPQLCQRIVQANQLIQDTHFVSRWLVDEDPTFIVLFQNTEELRATGGFMGSYARVQLKGGQISNLLIEDIYEPDGQFTGYVEAPTGVKEYLSSGQGLRLPDANWQADFPSAAQTIMNYFALGNEQAIDGVIAINSDLIERLLTVTGDVYLPDYGMTVTSENFTTLARADRDEFFPGSQQKTNFLSHFFNVFKVKLADLTPEQQRQLVTVLSESFQDKTIQVYSRHAPIQEVAERYHLAGKLAADKGDLLYLVESNVGINKANRDVSRTVHLTQRGTQTTITITFTNDTQELGYINYQRVIVPVEWTVDPGASRYSIWVDGHRVGNIDEEIITNVDGQEFRQVGWLVTVPAQSTVMTQITFITPAELPLSILKQPGLPPTPYVVTLNDQAESFVLTQDLFLN